MVTFNSLLRQSAVYRIVITRIREPFTIAFDDSRNPRKQSTYSQSGYYVDQVLDIINMPILQDDHPTSKVRYHLLRGGALLPGKLT